MANSKKIIFTGGGTAGHVTPNLALIALCKKAGWEISYIGSKNGVECQLTKNIAVKYYAIFTGKLRRYFSWENFLDFFKIIFGICQAFFLCRKIKPQVIFSKGGFVAFPVVVGAWLNRTPIISHESDITPGLANKLIYPFATKLCVTFEETKKYFKQSEKIVVTGTPIRESLLSGDANKGRAICGFTPSKKIILVFGGSLGAEKINQTIRKLLPNILTEFQVAHVCGAGKIDLNCNHSGYKQFTYLDENFGDVLAAADLVISRAGANTIYELLALRKPNILIPLGTASSRGDQISNANYAATHGFSQVILETELTAAVLLQKINWVTQNLSTIAATLAQFKLADNNIIFNLISQCALIPARPCSSRGLQPNGANLSASTKKLR